MHTSAMRDATFFCDFQLTDSHLSHKSDMPSADGTASLMPYFLLAMLTSGVTSQPFKLTVKEGAWL